MSSKKNISIEKTKYIARLANFRISEEEAQNLAKDLNDTLAYIHKVKKIDTTGFSTTHNVIGLSNVFRKDEIKPSLTQDEALSNAKNKYKGYFKIAAIIKK